MNTSLGKIMAKKIRAIISDTIYRIKWRLHLVHEDPCDTCGWMPRSAKDCIGWVIGTVPRPFVLEDEDGSEEIHFGWSLAQSCPECRRSGRRAAYFGLLDRMVEGYEVEPVHEIGPPLSFERADAVANGESFEIPVLLGGTLLDAEQLAELKGEAS